MTRLKDLIAEARKKNRKLKRQVTNHTYYRRVRLGKTTSVLYEVEGDETELEDFFSTITANMADKPVHVKIER